MEVGEVALAQPKGKTKKKDPKVPKPPAKPHIKWSSKKDVLLAKAWITVSLDPIVGANQNMDHYWKRVKTTYDERWIIDPEYSMIATEHGEKAMANYWAIIQHASNKWHGIQKEVQNRPKSGSNYAMEVRFLSPWFPLYHRRFAPFWPSVGHVDGPDDGGVP